MTFLTGTWPARHGSLDTRDYAPLTAAPLAEPRHACEPGPGLLDVELVSRSGCLLGRYSRHAHQSVAGYGAGNSFCSIPPPSAGVIAIALGMRPILIGLPGVLVAVATGMTVPTEHPAQLPAM